MKLVISRDALLAALVPAASVADRKSTIPILANVRLSALEPRLAVSATDLSLTVETSSGATVSEPGATTVPAKQLLDIVKSLDSGVVTMRLVDAKLELSAGKARFKLATLPAADYPKLPSAADAKLTPVDASSLSLGIARVLPSASVDETRYHLNGALIEGRRLVATDGHRLTVADLGTDVLPGVPRALVPRKALSELRRVLDHATEDVTAGVNGGYLHLCAGDTTLSAKLIDAQFPPWQQVVPTDVPDAPTVNREDLIAALRRVSLVASPVSRGVLIEVKGSALRVSAQTETGSCVEVVDVEYDGKPLRAGMNATYLLDYLSVCDSDVVRVCVGGELDPIALRPVLGGGLGVVMPMRI